MASTLATLGLYVDADGAVRALKGFDSAAKQSTQSANALEGVTRKLTAAFSAYAVLRVAQRTIEIADAYTNMRARLALVTTSSEQLLRVQTALFKQAQDSRTSLESTAELYARIARNAGQLGASERSLLTVTDAINKAMVISGTSAESASAALVQLGQAFASNRLGGDELRSVLEQAPRLAQAIADGMGVTVGKLRELGAEGKLTGKAVFDAVKSQVSALNSEVGKIPTTVAGALQQVRNAITQFVGGQDQASGASRELAAMLTKLANAIPRIGIELTNVLRAFKTAKDVFVEWGKQIDALGKQVDSFTHFLQAATSFDRGGIKKAMEENAKATDEYGASIKRVGQILDEARNREQQSRIGFIGPQRGPSDEVGANRALLEIDKERAKEVAKLNYENAARVREAQQALVMATLTGDAADRQAVIDKAINDEYKVRATLKKEDQQAAIDAIHVERTLGLMAVSTNNAIKERERLKEITRDNDHLAYELAKQKEQELNEAITTRIKKEGEAIAARLKLLAEGMANLPKPPVKITMDWAAALDQVAQSMRLLRGILGDTGKEVVAMVSATVKALQLSVAATRAANEAKKAGATEAQKLAANSASGAATGGLIGAIIAVGVSVFNMAKDRNKQLADEAERLAALKKAYDDGVKAQRDFIDGIGETAKGIAAIRKEFDTLRAQNAQLNDRHGITKAIYDIAHPGMEANELAKLNALEEDRIALFIKEQALIAQRNTEDLQVELMRAKGATEQADAYARQLEYERRIADAKDESTKALIREIQAADEARIAEEALAKARELWAQKAADALEALRQAVRDRAGLIDRGLATQGVTSSHSAQQEFEDAVKNGMSPTNLAMLAFVQFMEHEFQKMNDNIAKQTAVIEAQYQADVKAIDAQIAREQNDQKTRDKWFSDQLDASKKAQQDSQQFYNDQISATRANTKAQLDALDVQAKANQQQQAIASDQLQAAQANVQATKQAVDQLKSFTDSLALSDQSTLSPIQKLDEARRQFEAIASQAAGGDANAASGLPAVAQALLSASRGVNASNTGYASDYQRVQEVVRALSMQFGGSLTGATSAASQAQAQLDALKAAAEGIAQQREAIQTASDAQISELERLRDDANKRYEDEQAKLTADREAAASRSQALLDALNAQKSKLREDADQAILDYTKQQNELFQKTIQSQPYYETWLKNVNEDRQKQLDYWQSAQDYFNAHKDDADPTDIPITPIDPVGRETVDGLQAAVKELQTQNGMLARQLASLNDGFSKLLASQNQTNALIEGQTSRLSRDLQESPV